MIALNVGQENAVKEVHGFLSTVEENFMTIKGAPGTGKTTVVKHVVSSLEKYHKTRELLGMKGKTNLKVIFAATTNKACDALKHSLGAHNEVRTIHSHLGLVMETDPLTHKDHLVDSHRNLDLSHQLIFIDEASYIDNELMDFLYKKVHHTTKVVFLGDPAQLKNPGSNVMPAFDSGFREAELTEIMRVQHGETVNPIQPVCEALRAYILSGCQGDLPPPIMDNKHIHWLPRDKFDALLLKDMTSPDWSFNTSKLIAWRNKTVVSYNRRVNQALQGTPVFVDGDYAVNNHFVKGTKTTGALRTDAMVLIEKIEPTTSMGVKGYMVYLDAVPGKIFFMPEKHSDIINVQRKLLKTLTDDFEHDKPIHDMITTIKNTWVDLRPVFAQTVFKSQGSTYRRVFVDLSDIGACRDWDQKIRMLLVALSRAQMQVFLTGDL